MKHKNISDLMRCLVAAHQTLSVCSRCLECCDINEREIYNDLSKDAASMIKKINKVLRETN